MRISILHSIIALVFSLTIKQSVAQTLPDSTIKKVDSIFSKWNNTSSPGFAIGVVRNDSLIYAKGYGMANLEYGVPVSPETIFHMASVSKQLLLTASYCWRRKEGCNWKMIYTNTYP